MIDQVTTIPAGLRYDGIMIGLHQFTETDSSRPSYGASFYLKVGQANDDSLSRRREEKRIEFLNGL